MDNHYTGIFIQGTKIVPKKFLKGTKEERMSE